MENSQHHFTECGLSDVYLENGFEVIEGEWGSSVSITDMDELIHTIGLCIVSCEVLTGERVRFIRKHMDMTQKNLANLLDYDVQTIANWEKDVKKIPRPSEIVLRSIFREYLKGGTSTSVTAMIKKIAELNREAHKIEKLELSSKDGKWSHLASDGGRCVA